jgi:ABC-2 type transport system permease protein
MSILVKLSWVEIKLFVREPITLVFSLAFPLVLLFVLAQVFGNDPEPEEWRGFGPTDFYIPAYIGVVIASIGLIALPVHLAGYRERGILRRFRASSILGWAVLGAQVVVSFVVAAAGSVLLVAVAFGVYDVTAPSLGSGLQLAGAFGLGLLSFASLGVLLGSLLPTARAAQGAGLLLFFAMWLISGAGPPEEVLSDAIVLISDVLPLKHVTTLLQDPWFGLGWNITEMLIVLGVLVVSTILSLRFFRWE